MQTDVKNTLTSAKACYLPRQEDQNRLPGRKTSIVKLSMAALTMH